MATTDYIKNSIDYKCYKHDILLLTAGFIFLIVFIFIISFSALYNYIDYFIRLFLIYVIIFSCIFIPSIIIFICKLISLFKQSKDYIFFDTKLENTEKTFCGTKFIINIENPISKQAYSSSFRSRRIADLLDKNVMVGYNTSTNKVIIINK